MWFGGSLQYGSMVIWLCFVVISLGFIKNEFYSGLNWANVMRMFSGGFG